MTCPYFFVITYDAIYAQIDTAIRFKLEGRKRNSVWNPKNQLIRNKNTQLFVADI